MSIPRPPASAWLASGALAIVVLFVFFVLQDYGPEAAIRKFHQAVAQQSNQELQYLSYPPSQTPGTLTPTALDVAAYLSDLLRSHPRVQIYAVSRHPGSAAAVVTYFVTGDAPRSVVWIVRKTDSVWKIDTQATAEVSGLKGYYASKLRLLG